MFRSSNEPPGLVPVLSRGKHRNARKGACFMEFAAYLAGERWSDHPRCTHPLLSELARMVNDSTSDENRTKLAVLVPSVIGLNSDDVRVDARITMLAARTALPVVSVHLQNVMAVGILTVDRLLDDLDGPSRIRQHESREALAQVPAAEVWARRFAAGQKTSEQGFRRHAGPNIIRCAVQGISHACITNHDQMLHDLLRDAISECAAACGHVPERPVLRSSDVELAEMLRTH